MNPVAFKGEILSEREKRNLAILETIRRFGPVTRSDISQTSGLNVVTTSNYIDDLLRKKIVIEKELDISEGGRRPVLLDLNPQAGLAIGVGVNLLDIVGVIVGLKGNILSRTRTERYNTSSREVAALVFKTIFDILDKIKIKDNVKGIGIGIAGIVDKKDGSIRWPERAGGSYTYTSIYLPLKEEIEKKFSLTCIVENDATCACMGEQWLGLQQETKNIIYMFSGVGCGIMINGELYTGSTGSAGEVSIYNYKEDSLFNCDFGKPCFLKRWEVDLGMVEDAKERIRRHGTTGVGKRVMEIAEDDINKVNLKAIFQAIKENDPLACDVVRLAGRRFGIKLAYLINLLNPEAVVIGGGLEEAGNIFLETVKQTVSEWTFEEMNRTAKISYSLLRENATALGAASLIVRRTFAQV